MEASSSVSKRPGRCNMHIMSLLMTFEQMWNSVHISSSHLTSCSNILLVFPAEIVSYQSGHGSDLFLWPSGLRVGYTALWGGGGWIHAIKLYFFFYLGGPEQEIIDLRNSIVVCLVSQREKEKAPKPSSCLHKGRKREIVVVSIKPA